MKVIYKYYLTPTVLLPKDALILKAGMQDGGLYIWAIIDPNEKTHIEREFEIVGTGHQFDYKRLKYTFIDTIFDGPLVWHIFEVNDN